ncbi:hypothetical protein mRhiFer1_008919 [Rhinolophus ferrumequinum]|uniref:Uncharacterized protein n=1 Tax=Rhinolophus ferrumequinum TaxID=59479 RepID=A0A7J7TEP2_RHIFE|nr:hypothetical protein mRhiFer1_008919 [Rhinolophus ferrumequinum]
MSGCFLENPSSFRCACSSGAGNRSSRLTKAPCFSCGMFVLSSLVAVLTEGLPAAFLYFCPVGGSGCTRSWGLLFWRHGFFVFFFFLKCSTPPLHSAKYFFKKGDVSCIWMNGPPAWMRGQRKQTCLNPSISETTGGGEAL